MNQPSRDRLANGNALTRFEREDTTYQRTLSLTDLHVFSLSVLNEFRGGFFRNRNDSSPVAYFTNAEFGIVNPLDSKVPDLTQLDIRGDRDVGGRVRFGTPRMAHASTIYRRPIRSPTRCQEPSDCSAAARVGLFLTGPVRLPWRIVPGPLSVK